MWTCCAEDIEACGSQPSAPFALLSLHGIRIYVRHRLSTAKHSVANVYMYACAYACVRACVRACMCVGGEEKAQCDGNEIAYDQFERVTVNGA